MHSFPTQFSIGPLSIAPATVLAPMAGVTDTVFRRFIRNLGGCGLIMTEFTSSHGVSASLGAAQAHAGRCSNTWPSSPKSIPFRRSFSAPIPAVMADAARVCQDLGFDILDINFGCPVNKVVKCNGGSGLLRDLPLVERLLREVRAGHHHPVHHEIPRRLERSRTGRRARWRAWPRIAACRPSRCIRARASRATAARPIGRRIAEVKAAVKIPVIGNGDIVTPEDAVRMVRETGCDAVMIGRARQLQSLDLPPDRAVPRHRRLRRSPPQQDRYQMMRATTPC